MSSLPRKELLRATARSFYLTLRVLPAAIQRQIGFAYLVARAADTIADTEIVPIDRRLDALQKLREGVQGTTPAKLDLKDFAGKQGAPAEKLLLEEIGSTLNDLQTFSPEDQKRIRDVLATITSGQSLDLHRFSSPVSADGTLRIIALETAADLDDYTYRVAGCVGEFWTKICRAHLFPSVRMDEEEFRVNGVRFGKGLQLINILRDLPADLKRGRCYLPMDKLEKYKLSPATLLSQVNESRFHPLFAEYLDKAESHLRAGWDYTNMLPFNQFRVRLACAWPILIGIKTIEKLRQANVIELRQGIKIPRPDVRRLIVKSVLACPISSAWKNLFPAKAVALQENLA
ncbi:MAG TPA: phytoene/squalene synthase family protein [Candidatus Acidoferrales bacterium]|jgi:farnesyl-diphosphate farnesyltransferase|nr:phytoene/squalene synthase family protein [Candidatus Acidoferrales bacterium]